MSSSDITKTKSEAEFEKIQLWDVNLFQDFLARSFFPPFLAENSEIQAHKGQESLEKKVALLEAHQKEIHDSLVSMENVALRMFQVTIPIGLVHARTPDLKLLDLEACYSIDISLVEPLCI